MTWFDSAEQALGAGKHKLALRKVRKKATEAHRAEFIQWVLRDFIKSGPAGLAIADLWGRGAVSEQEWGAARQAACDERDAANAGDLSYVAYQIDRGLAVNRRPDLNPEKNAVVAGSKDADPAGVELFKMIHDRATLSVAPSMAAEVAFSASFPDRPECMRGIIQCASFLFEDQPAALKAMAVKLCEIIG